MHRRNRCPKSGGTKRGPKGRSSKAEGLRAGVGLKNWILVYFGTKFCCFSRLKWSKSGGTNNIGVPRTVISGGTRPPASPRCLRICLNVYEVYSFSTSPNLG